jgi:hypothetical protein
MAILAKATFVKAAHLVAYGCSSLTGNPTDAAVMACARM